MKYLRKFRVKDDYTAYLQSNECITPHIAMITEKNNIEDQPDASGGGIELCDVAYWDGSEVKTVSSDEYNTSMGIAIGVVVIPEGFAPDGKARIIGLKPMDKDGNMTDSHTSMAWGGSGTDTTLTKYTKVPITNNMGSASTESYSYGYLPSDAFTGVRSYVDPDAKYGKDSKLIPSPYLGEEPNPEYYKVVSGNNVLSDFNGLTNTQLLVKLGTKKYVPANACWYYNDGANSNIQWYLPAMGELGYIMPRFNEINSVITSLGGVAVSSNQDDDFWSSSEEDKSFAYVLSTGNGAVSSAAKINPMYVRAFALVG